MNANQIEALAEVLASVDLKLFGLSGLRAADEAVDQLAEQLREARREIAELRHALAQERHAAAARAVVDAFEQLERSPETILH